MMLQAIDPSTGQFAHPKWANLRVEVSKDGIMSVTPLALPKEGIYRLDITASTKRGKSSTAPLLFIVEGRRVVVLLVSPPDQKPGDIQIKDTLLSVLDVRDHKTEPTQSDKTALGGKIADAVIGKAISTGLDMLKDLF